MIIVKLMGGLGNQLFQYALGRNLAYKNNTRLKLDVNFFNHSLSRHYALSYFNIDASFATPDDLTHLFSPDHIIKEKSFYFDPIILNLPDNIYLDGYWQSQQYFIAIDSLLRKEFTPRLQLSTETLSLLDQINSVNSVSIHIRRGDYVYNPVTNKIHGIVPLTYYEHAIELITKRISNPHFFIFSDQPDWVKSNLRLNFPFQIVECNQEQDDLLLMSYCQHNIIANSTFSWWSAWLNSNEKKIVIAPLKWFNNFAYTARDLLLSTWITL